MSGAARHTAASVAQAGHAVPVLAQILLLGVMSGIQSADPTIASTALIDSSRTLGMTAGTQTIAASISTLMLAATVISTGLLADRIGRRRLLVIALLTAMLGDLIAAASPEPITYMVGRAVAGVGLGAVFGASFAYVRAVVPAGKVPAAMGTFGAFGMVGTIGASFAGGALASVDWRLAFLVIPVMCALSVVATLFLLPHQPPQAAGPADALGQALLAFGLIGVLYGISHAGIGLAKPLTWAPILVGAVLLAVFAMREARSKHPFYPVALFANLGFIAAVCMGLAFNFAQAISTLQFANIWQFVYGFSTVEVSMAQLPLAAASVASALWVGRLLTKGMSPARVVAITGTSVVAGFALLCLVLATKSFWAFVPALVLIGLGMGGMVPYGSLILQLAPPAQFGAVTSSRTTIGQIGYSIGLSGGMVLINALSHNAIIDRLRDAGVPPSRTGQALDAISQFTTQKTVPSDIEGTSILADAAVGYKEAFVWTMLISAAVIAVLCVVAVIAYRRWEASAQRASGV